MIFEMFVGTVLLSSLVMAAFFLVVGVFSLISEFLSRKKQGQLKEFFIYMNWDKFILNIILPLTYIASFGIVHVMVI